MGLLRAVTVVMPKLVGGFNSGFYFHTLWDNPNPIDELRFFKMVKTTNQIMSLLWNPEIGLLFYTVLPVKQSVLYCTSLKFGPYVSIGMSTLW